MVLPSVGPFARCLRALIFKNYLVSVARKPVGFFLFIYAVPIAILAILVSIPDFVTSTSKHGQSTPEPIRNLTDVVDKKLVVVQPPHLGPDVARAVDAFTEGIDPELLQFETSDAVLGGVCAANLRGVSPCFGAVTFVDSPRTTEKVPQDLTISFDGHKDHSWAYALRFDPARSEGTFDANKHDNNAEKYHLPLQLAINKAIANITSTPESFAFTRTAQDVKARQDQEEAVRLIVSICVFALFACYLIIIYRHTYLITSERESGMSQLIDSMGGGSAAAARVLSWLLVFNLSCLPVFIIFGVVFSKILFPTADTGLLMGWQILLGLAVNSSTVFAAAFFTKARVSSVYVVLIFLALTVGAQVHAYDGRNPPGPAGPYIMSLLFPSSNFVFFTIQMCVWELLGLSPDVGVQPVVEAGKMAPQIASYKITQGQMLAFLVVQIVVYPVLAIIAESLMHGIDFQSRSFEGDGQSASTGGAVAETFDLQKRFTPNMFKRIFCGGKRGNTVHAVNGVSFKARKGQILCLVGPNGSGKTTTLHMMSGFTIPTSGTVKLGASPSQIGICPQRNTHWDDLTVDEHVYLWGRIKAAAQDESAEERARLIASCDLEAKRGSQSKTLSGGQKRKLQLACMFVGGSSVCLIDECTSGLDPLSRRVIWEILLEQRARRSIVFTTHFLDEVDVLADDIVILTKGSINCQGAAAELKNRYGGGYRVLVPRDVEGKFDVEYPSAVHQDRLVYTTPDSRSAAELSSTFTRAGVLDVGIAGPEIEDVFLRVAGDDASASSSMPKIRGRGDSSSNRTSSLTPVPNFELEPARVLPFVSQLGILFRKRITILKRMWFPYLWVVALPLVITPFLKDLVLYYEPPSCMNLESTPSMPSRSNIMYTGDYCEGSEGGTYYGCNTMAIAPPSANNTLYDLLMDGGFSDLASIDNATYYQFADVQDTRQELVDRVVEMRQNAIGGIYMEDGHTPVVGFYLDSGGWGTPAIQILNIWTEMESGTEVISAIGRFAVGGPSIDMGATIYAIFFTLIHAIWPAAMVLYPAIEKGRKVRALEYANGVRRGPLWMAYGLFDAMFVVLIAAGCSVCIHFQVEYWNGPGMLMIPILFLYGMAAVLLGYVISHFVTGPLKSFLATAGIGMLMYAVVAISFSLGSGWSGPESVDNVTNGLTFGLNLVIPIGNVFRALLLGGNVRQVGCRDGMPTPPMSIYAYGGPILYLAIQVVALLLIIIWIEGDLAFFRRKGFKAAASASTWKDSEKTGSSARNMDVEEERQRVEEADDDLLRVLSVDKSFGSNHAVQNVSLGLPSSDVMALLGPNGAGKSTLVNMIQSELSPEHGRILLKGEDARTRSAQRFLGICPQFDALDLMTTREHLQFYARIKGIRDINANVNHIMTRLDLSPHAKTQASKLSGGNKRKLSLAIALMGAPPVIVLDEPTSAMDAVAKRSFWRLIREIITPGRSVLLTTHSMEEADALATRAAIIAGRLLAVGTTQALRERYSNLHHVSLLLSSAPASSDKEMAAVREWVQESIPGARLERAMLGGQVRFTIPGTDATGWSPVPAVIELLERERENVGVEYYSVGGATLETVFLSVARENNAQEEDGGAVRRNLLSRLFRW